MSKNNRAKQESDQSREDCQIQTGWPSVKAKYKDSFDHDNLYFAPNVPQKVFRRAIVSYAPEVTSEEILVLLDEGVYRLYRCPLDRLRHHKNVFWLVEPKKSS